MHSYLQTKAVSLALEAKYIRFQELRFSKKFKKARELGKDISAGYFERNREGQYLHRIGIVREEARITNIARGFLRGHNYESIEQNAYTQPNWKRIRELVLQYGEENPKHNELIKDRFEYWSNEANLYFMANQLKRSIDKTERSS